ncbi:MAG: RNA polymerase sigma factor [Phycisphaerales bacterium]|nr:RNA polymerase sigma factor [Phycisphaerales bacterium]
MNERAANNPVESLFVDESYWLTNVIERTLRSTSVGADVSPDDVLQNVFLTAHAKSATLDFSDRQAMRSWLKKTTKNVVLKIWESRRAVKRGGSRSAIRLDWLSSNMVGLIDELNTTDTPSSRVSQTEVANILRMEIERLPNGRRQAMKLKFFEGMSESSIAEKLGKTPSAIRSYIFRGLQSLWDQRCLRDIATNP